jgi:acetate kinase
MSRVLVLNCGSSTVKYRAFDGSSETAKGLIEKLSSPDDFDGALRRVLNEIDSTDLAAVGHRVVHGGDAFTGPVVLDDQVIKTIESLVPLAPLHNPPALAGIAATRKLLPDVPQVAVFDTAFHQTIPPAGRTFAIDAGLAQRWGLRRYGFHGTSHRYVSRRATSLLDLNPADARIVSLHLGNGASACAVSGGRSIATSMGMSPQGGLVMGTRSGDLDPTVIFELHRTAGLPLDEIETSLTRYAGLQGLAGDNDMRTVLQRRAGGDAAAALAFDVYCRRLTEYVGSYLALLGGADAIVFTGGVGENAPAVRAAALAGLESLGIAVDPERNDRGDQLISPDGTPLAVCVIPTDEELEIATQARAII